MVACGFATSVTILEPVFPGVRWQEGKELKENIVNCSTDRTQS